MRTVAATLLLLAAGVAAVPFAAVQGFYGWWRTRHLPDVDPPSRDEIAALLDDLTDEDLRRLLARWTVEEYGL